RQGRRRAARRRVDEDGDGRARTVRWHRRRDPLRRGPRRLARTNHRRARRRDNGGRPVTSPLANQSLDIAALADGYASGKFTPADIIEEVYRRIAEAGERPIWISLVPKETAL